MAETIDEKTTKVVRIQGVNHNQLYYRWLGDIKTRYRNAQIKAAVIVNADQQTTHYTKLCYTKLCIK